MYCGQISFFIPHPFSGESSSGNHSVEEKKHFSSERRKPWYTEDDVDNSSWTQIECCIWSVGQSDPAVIRCSLATTLEWILKAGFYLLIISRTPPNAFAALSWGRISTMRNTDKDKQKPRQRQKDRCTFLSFELIGKLLACSDSIRILGSERGLSWAVLVCNSFTMTHTQIRKKNKYTQRIPSCTNTQPYTLTHRDKNKLINTQAHRQKQAHRSNVCI